MGIFSSLFSKPAPPASPPVIPPSPAPSAPKYSPAITKAALFVSRFESFVAHPYLPTKKDRWTIGYGTTVYPDGREVTEHDPPCTHEQALEWKDAFIAKTALKLKAACVVPLTIDQEAALLSLGYNIGDTNLITSSVIRHLNQRDYAGAADHFLDWDKQKGVVLPGLVSRRKTERDIFLGKVP